MTLLGGASLWRWPDARNSREAGRWFLNSAAPKTYDFKAAAFRNRLARAGSS
jgi:hypothetical protein